MCITSVFLLLGFVQTAWAIVALALFYFARGIATPVLKHYVNRITSSDIRATVLSLRSLIIRLLFTLLAPCYGTLSDHYGRPMAMKLLGLTFTLLVGVSLFLFFRSMNNAEAGE